MPKIQQKKFNSIFDILEKIMDLAVERIFEEISTTELLYESRKIINSNQQFALIKRVDKFKFRTPNIFIYYYLIWETLNGKESISLRNILEIIYDNASQRIHTLQNFYSNNPLIKKNLIEIDESQFINGANIKLSDYSYEILNNCDIKILSHKKQNNNLIISSDITYKKLIYNHSEKKQLSLLNNLLEETKLTITQERLKEKGLPHGITVLLHGVPGTGKTETVKQIAKKCKRDIIKVEISQSKSMWFGESEKIIKQIFTDYKSFAKTCKRAPILLFNEAEAIISKRQELNSSNIAKTENTMQNIILEELENFEGILIATTNLVNNLDKAFERRFLFKIKFHKPDIANKSQIWKLKLAHLSNSDCEILASKFNFSGGEIDNIVRKNEIHEIVHGHKVNFNNILNFCKEESLNNTSVKIGFKNNK